MSTMATKERNLRKRAHKRGQRILKRGNYFELLEGNDVRARGTVANIEEYFANHHVPTRSSRPRRLGARTIPASWTALVDDYSTWLSAIGRSPGTIELRRYQLAKLANDLDKAPRLVTQGDLEAWFGRHPDWKPETRRGNRAAACSFFEWASKRGRVEHNPAKDLPLVKVPKAHARPAPDLAWRYALLAADRRVELMLRLAAEAGLRRAEVARVNTRDLVESVGGPQLIVLGKGGRRRAVPITEDLADRVRAGAASHTPGMPSTGWLFPDGLGGHLSPAHVGNLVKRVLPEDLTIHTLRHRFASRAYRGSHNLRAVQSLLGHSSVATTERYIDVNEDEIRAAMLAALG